MDQIGEYLRQARITKGLTLAQVEEDTKIRGKYLDALEHGRYHILPGRVYTIGFIRLYARYLGLDADEIVSRYKLETTVPEPHPQPEVPKPVMVKRKRIRPGRLAVVLLLLVLVCTAGVFLVKMLFRTDSAGPSAGSPVVAPTQALQSPNQPKVAVNPPQAGDAGPRPETTVPQPEAAGNTVIATTPASAVPIDAVNLELLVEKDRCWIGVVRDGVRDFEGTLEAGARQTFTAERDLVVRLGYPVVVLIKLNGQELGRPGSDGEPVTLKFDKNGVTVLNSTAGITWN